jgi:trehalose 6-phosphate phosphatase
LIEFADHPDQIVIPPVLPELLQLVDRVLNGALVIVTGRTIESLDRHLIPPDISCAALHGCDVRLKGTQRRMAPHKLGDIADKLRDIYGEDSGLLIEDKGANVALHYRHAPRFARDAEHLLRQLVRDLDVTIVPGKYVFEARPYGINKGTALLDLMTQAPFRGRSPVFVGDDFSDEDAIAAAQSMGGFGIKVGPGETAAHWRLDDPTAVHAWLAASCAAIDPKPSLDTR